ncbi:4-coumarate--CoA ligase [Sphingomonas sp. PP-F2F-G114-C0414]|uniref:AMP-binding protein n=1 Tax=Sphingomonas sp. PP-F2F-G114-C0414 TaxID=2135662 RepID=UPI000F16F0B3|nr:AMP-binding protein [Sphingomonas sp. PP-F2F-G114-C0414]RMB39156.1 4-coumarate--CoA ligase [Sphingomonas sp. PP-F2F-G114-C0414]
MTTPRLQGGLQRGLQRAAAHRIVCAVVAAELRRLRDSDSRPTAPEDWLDSTPINDAGLGLDSMEQLGALGALAEAFDLDDSVLSDDPPRTVGAWVDWVLHAHAAGDGRMTVVTSGSTGHPRPCVHAVADLLDEAAFFAGRFAGRRRVVALVPAHHLYGIVWTGLLPDALGVPVVVRTIGTPLGLAAGDLVVAVPDQWQALRRLIRRFPEDIVGVSSGGSLDDDVAAGLLAAGLSRLADIYGASETGGIALRDTPTTATAPAYDLLPRWQLLPDGDGDWRLVDRTGRSFDLPDHIERIGERTLRPIGRRDGAVQVAGHNVWPERIARELRSVDGVADAAVRLHVNGRLKAFIVPTDHQDTALLAARIDQLVTPRLTDPERPKSLRFGPALPRNAMGKLEDWA